MVQSTGATSRRNVIRGAAWTAPVIVAAGAAPAFAASTSVLTASLDPNSFRAADNVGLFNGIPSAGPAMAIAVSVQVANAAVTGLTCSLTAASGQTLSFYNVGSAFTRPALTGTTWQANNAALAANGWSATPVLPANAAVGSPITGTAVNGFVFTRGTPVAAGTSVPLRLVMFNVATADFPLTFQFSAPATPTPPALVVNVGQVATA